MSAIIDAEKKAREVILALEPGRFNAFNIGAAEAMIRRLDGVIRESDGRTWCFSPTGGVHGSWKKSDGRYVREHYV